MPECPVLFSLNQPQWKLKWTIAAMAIFVLMFVTTMSMTGLIHQASWLAKSPIKEASWGKTRSYGNITLSILLEIDIGLESYYEANKHLPIVSEPVPFKEIQIHKKYYQGRAIDQWGMLILYFSDSTSYVLRSYGKNRILGGGMDEFDDLVYSDGQILDYHL